MCDWCGAFLLGSGRHDGAAVLVCKKAPAVWANGGPTNGALEFDGGEDW